MADYYEDERESKRMLDIQRKGGKGCSADHSRLRGQRCDVCGTYFRGDDNS